MKSAESREARRVAGEKIIRDVTAWLRLFDGYAPDVRVSDWCQWQAFRLRADENGIVWNHPQSTIGSWIRARRRFAVRTVRISGLDVEVVLVGERERLCVDPLPTGTALVPDETIALRALQRDVDLALEAGELGGAN